MTGFASLTREDERATISVTIRAVNHRFLDLQLRAPQSLAAIEARRAGAGRSSTSRADASKLSVVAAARAQTAGVEVEFNEAFVEALAAALERARERGLVTGALTPGDLLRLPQAITIRERPTGRRRATQAAVAPTRARAAVAQALDRSRRDAVRAKAAHLRADLDARRRARSATWSSASRRRPTRGARRCERGWPSGSRELRADLPADETAVAQEIVRIATRSDISEEVRGSAPTSRTGARWPTRPSRAAASSISCCRR